MKVLRSISLLLCFTLCIAGNGYAQDTEEITDDLGNVSDAFQENFFEALKQKGIENYELALEALNKAEQAANKSPESEAVVFFERGKNLAYLKRFEEAEANYQKVLSLQGDRLDVMEALYDVYFQQKNYDAAIPLVMKLIERDEDYKEDLVNLYSRTRQYDKALELLDELDSAWGVSDYRDAVRKNIYRVTGNTSGEIKNLEARIDANPKKEKDYLNLIFLYSEQGETKKAFETAKELQKNHPKSEIVHLALYKFHLDDGAYDDAVRSMKIVFKSNDIDRDNKYRVLSDFLSFVDENPTYEKDLDEVVQLFSEENSGQVFERLGNYFVSKGKKDDALKFYEKGIVTDSDNFSLLKNTLLLQIDFKKYTEAEQLSREGLEIFPAQPLLYLLNGVANVGLDESDAAIESLETGVDFLLDDPKMERDFYRQLELAYKQKGDTRRADLYARKAAQIKLPN